MLHPTASTPPRLAPGPRGLPIVGSLLEFARDPIAFLQRAVKHGDIVSFRAGPTRMHLLASAALVREVLVERSAEFEQHAITREVFGRVLGNGILVSDGDFHHRQRRLMQPAFLARRIEGYAGAMVEEIDRIVSTWKAGDRRDLGAEMLRIAARVVARTLFGTDVTDRASTEEATRVLQAEASKQFRAVWIPPAWLPTPQNLRLRRATRQMEAILLAEISRRRASSENAQRDDLLALLMLATDEEGSGTMTDRQLRDEALTIFLPGFETTSNGLTWLFYRLATHPEIDARVADEVRRTLGARLPGRADLPALAFTERVVKESLRLHAPIWAFNRTPKKPTTIGGYDVAPGDLVLISPTILHTQERYFARPLSFEPERFAEPSHPRHAYLPFGAGPHVCIGAQFAVQEMVLVLATIASRYRLVLSPGQRVEAAALVSLRPKRPVRIELVRRA